MAVTGVRLTADAYLVCLTHALSTEKEEIMGLLIGEIDESRVCCISAVLLLRRSDKRPDRVEISPEQLSAASTHSEDLAKKLQRPMRIVGWYHSHPHITVWPSHVDVQTQDMYQMMDPGFVGLIFSVFNHDKSNKHNTIQVTCFQSTNQSPEGEPPQLERIEIPLHIERTDSISQPCLDSLAELPSILCQEEEEMYKKSIKIPNLDVITCIHNGAVFTKTLCHIMQVLTGPLMDALESRQRNNLQEISNLKKEKLELEQRLLAQKDDHTSKHDAKATPKKTTSV